MVPLNTRFRPHYRPNLPSYRHFEHLFFIYNMRFTFQWHPLQYIRVGWDPQIFLDVIVIQLLLLFRWVDLDAVVLLIDYRVASAHFGRHLFVVEVPAKTLLRGEWRWVFAGFVRPLLLNGVLLRIVTSCESIILIWATKAFYKRKDSWRNTPAVAPSRLFFVFYIIPLQFTRKFLRIRLIKGLRDARRRLLLVKWGIKVALCPSFDQVCVWIHTLNGAVGWGISVLSLAIDMTAGRSSDIELIVDIKVFWLFDFSIINPAIRYKFRFWERRERVVISPTHNQLAKLPPLLPLLIRVNTRKVLINLSLSCGQGTHGIRLLKVFFSIHGLSRGHTLNIRFRYWLVIL